MNHPAFGAHTIEPPSDAYYFAYIIVVILGLSSLFPWNVFITASSYFQVRFCGTPYRDSFENYFSLAYTLSNSTGLALSVIYQQYFTFHAKVIFPLCCYGMLFALTTILVLMPIDRLALFWITLISTALCGVFGSFLSAGLFGLGAILPESYMGAVMTGQGAAGLVVALSNAITTWMYPQPLQCSKPLHDASDQGDFQCPGWYVDTSALRYFIFATMMVFVCMGAFQVLQNLPFTRYYIQRAAQPEDHLPQDSNVALRRSQGQDVYQLVTLRSDSEHDPRLAACFDTETLVLSGLAEGKNKMDHSPIHHPSDDIQCPQPVLLSQGSRGNDQQRGRSILAVFSDLRLYAVSVMFSFVVTIGLFPSIIVQISSTQRCRSTNRLSNDMFLPTLFLLFNLFDCIGRSMAGLVYGYFHLYALFGMAVLRVIFFPLFLLCNIESSSLPVIFENEFYPMIFMALFAFSNGLLSTCCMIKGPATLPPNEAQLAGTIMSSFLSFGLATGAVVAYLTVLLSTGGD